MIVSNSAYISRKLMAMLFFVMTFKGYSQTAYFPPEVMHRVYSSIYQHVKLYYPQSEILVSYYLEDSDIYPIVKNLYGKRKLRTICNMMTKAVIAPMDDEYSEILVAVFESENKCVTKPMYELWFSFSEYNIIMCTLYPYGKRDSSWGAVESFSFGFNSDGEIDYMSYSRIHRN